MQTLGQIAAERIANLLGGETSISPRATAAFCRQFGQLEGPLNATLVWPGDARRTPREYGTSPTLPMQHIQYLPQTIMENDGNPVEILRETLTKVATTRAADGDAQEGDFSLSLVTRNYWNVAELVPVTLEALTDANKVRAYIDNRLMSEVMSEIDRRVGIALATSTDDTTKLVRGSASLQAGIDNALSAVAHQGRARPTVIFAADDAVDAWEAADALQNKRIRYVDGMPYYKGLPVARSQSFDATNWGAAVSAPVHTEVIFHPNVVISMSESHQRATDDNDFEKLRVSIRAWARATLAVYRPAAVVRVSTS